VAQAAAGTGSVSENIGGVAGAVERTGYSANELLTAATALSSQSDQLKAEVAKFLATVRQAA
jgi:methyl-accepting chemotaxis protein